jgi:hypothetical protein
METWRAEVSPMLKWMTRGLAQAAQKEAAAKKESILAAQRARQRAHQARVPQGSATRPVPQTVAG